MLFTPKTASSSSPLLRQLVSGLALLSILGTRVVASQPLDGGDYEDNIDFIINNSGDENNDDEVVGNDGEGGVDEEGDERFGQCTDAVATWVSVNKKYCGINYPYPVTWSKIDTLRMELDAGCGKLGEECRAGRADAFAQVAAVCDKSWMVYIAPEGEGEEEDNGAMLFQVSDLLEKTNMVVPQGPECTIKNEVNNEYCVLDFKTELETGCLSDKKRCNEEDETAKVCNSCFADLYNAIHNEKESTSAAPNSTTTTNTTSTNDGNTTAATAIDSTSNNMSSTTFSVQGMQAEMELVRKTKLDAKCGGFNNFLSQKMKQNRNTRIVGTANDGSATSAVAKKLLAGLWCVAAVALLMG